MKIIDPSAEIIEQELAGLSICQRIDRCASVCYQRPPKPTEEEAEQFCRHLIERGHLPALEMAVVHLVMPWQYLLDDLEGEKYLSVHWPSSSGNGIVSGSIRALMEAVTNEDHSVFEFLSIHLPLFFNPKERLEFDYRDFVDDIRFAPPDEVPWQHKHVAVRVVCSRAISHQLVRHRPCSFLQESQRYCKYDDEVTFIRPIWAGESLSLELVFANDCDDLEEMYRMRRKARGLSPQQARGVLPNDTKTELIVYASLPEWRHIFKMRCDKAADPEMRRIMIPLREQFRAEYPDMWEGEVA